MQNTVSIMIVGVGGQGTLLASKILGNVFIRLGYDVKVSEVHGMSQRGGSVVTYVLFGEKVFSPIIDPKEADFILSFEQLEALRWVDYLKKDGTMIVNTQKISPMPVITRATKYPEEILKTLGELSVNLVQVDALDIAKSVGSVKAVNVVMVGILAKYLKIEKQVFLDAIGETVPPKFLEMNLKAFEQGFKL